MYVDLINSIKETLESVSGIKSVYPHPMREGDKISGYPAVVFYPDTSRNEFTTVRDNKKDYTFKIYVIVDASQKSLDDIFTDILPNAVDKVTAEFDGDWEVSVEGASVSSWLIDSGLWTISTTDKAFEAIAELNLRVRMLVPV